MIGRKSMVTIMDGAKLADEIRVRVRSGVEELQRYGVEKGLALLLVGENPASRQYFGATLQAGKKAGIKVHEYHLPATATVNEVLGVISAINRDEMINGLLVLLPLPQRINARRVVNAINPEKDIDGLGAISVGRLAADESTFQLIKDIRPGTANHILPLISGFLPCTPFGVMRLLEHYHIGLKGQHAVIIGKSFAVGKPLSLMMLAKEATVTVCHRETGDLAQFTRQADILCSATGKTGLITADMVKPGAVVVDIGINVLTDGTIVGDVDYGPVSQKASYITPVPGGVGPVTIAMLLENTLLSAQRSERSNSPFMMV
jgi:methylenetetrahydrofolate dehydrogenase (NADP+) / methenyltetrahydrofolate cyclohydrolase